MTPTAYDTKFMRDMRISDPEPVTAYEAEPTIVVGPLAIVDLARYTQTTAFKQLQRQAREEAEAAAQKDKIRRCGRFLLGYLFALALTGMVAWFATAGAR